MQRRFFLTAVPCLALGEMARAALPDDQPQPHHTVSAAQLQQAVAQRFPLRYPVAGLQNLALADGLGMQPGSITVTDKCLVTGFVLRPL